MNNEEKILAMLEKHSEMLEALTEKVDRHGEQLTRLEERVEKIDERSQRTAVLLETEVERKLNLLYEGHDAIMESLDQLASKDRVEALESDVSVVKDVVRQLRKDVNDLKKAQ